MKLTTESFDKDMLLLIGSINEILEYEKSMEVETTRINKQIKETITNISHDLRTPLTSTIGYIQLIKSGNIEEEKKQEYYRLIENRLKHLNYLIDKFFEYTRVIEGKDEINIREVNLCNVVSDIVVLYYDDFIEKNFEVNLNIPEKALFIETDTNILKRVIQNLIQNVLIHGKEKFELNINEQGNEIMFKNRTNDIQDIKVENLFERFYKVDTSRTKNSTGLGLAIVKELIKKINGKIEAYKDEEFLYIKINLNL